MATKKMKVLFLAAEADPFVKVGGLGDVSGSLPRALRNLTAVAAGGRKLDVRLILPLHPVVRTDVVELHPVLTFSMEHADGEVHVQVYETNLDKLPVYFLSAEPINNVSTVYSTNSHLDGEKYVFFSLAALEAARKLDWQPDVIHANDWHTALACFALHEMRDSDEFFKNVRSVLSVHNLPFMGPNVTEVLAQYGLNIPITNLPWWGNSLPLPLGLWGADAIVAVSPTYAREMLTPVAGCGLEAFLTERVRNVSGIVNGIDVRRFNPTTDPVLVKRFSVKSLASRLANKRALQEQLNLTVKEVPLFAIVSRFDPQKGMDLVFDALRFISDLEWQAVLLGTGDADLETQARRLQADYTNRVRAETRFDARLANQIYAGADMLMMPSRYEPCGLSQMIAMRYGCVPVVRSTGGLVDTVRDGETGFVFAEPSSEALSLALRRAMSVYKENSIWTSLQQAGMQRDFSWAKSALQYAKVYNSLVIGM